MLVRHGLPFWNELYGDNHWRRLVTGRHGDRGSFEYFIRELGYGVYPWILLAPSALAWVAMRIFPPSSAGAAATAALTATATGKRRDILWFGAIWLVAGYALVSLSMTKFHHYILPALPGLAIAIGCFLDDVEREGRGRPGPGRRARGRPALGPRRERLGVGAQGRATLHLALLLRLRQYPQGRPWPPDMSYGTLLWVSAGLFAGAALLLAWRHLRPWATVATLGIAVGFTYFLLDIFIPRAAAHWSQKPLIAQYYQERASADEHLLAWQLYWRGENFYTQNEIYQGPMSERTVFLGDRNTENLKDYVAHHHGKRAFFIIERTRLDGLKGILPEPVRSSVRIVNDGNNKFYLLSAQL